MTIDISRRDFRDLFPGDDLDFDDHCRLVVKRITDKRDPDYINDKEYKKQRLPKKEKKNA